MPNHINLFIITPRFDTPSKRDKLLKGISARELFLKCLELRKELWG